MNNNLNVKRHELKFYISLSDYEYARHILNTIIGQDDYQENDRGYFIRSLYFDDIYDTAVLEKLAGVETRQKVRLRIYDPNQTWAKLELKAKDGSYVDKTSLTLTQSQAQKIINQDYDFLPEMNSQTANSFYYIFKTKFLQPVSVIDYMREAYTLDYNQIRITFDKNIRVNNTNFNLFDSDLQTLPIQKDNVIIMEIKFNNFLPSWFEKFFKFESANHLAISKYCQARMFNTDYYETLQHKK